MIVFYGASCTHGENVDYQASLLLRRNEEHNDGPSSSPSPLKGLTIDTRDIKLYFQNGFGYPILCAETMSYSAGFRP